MEKPPRPLHPGHTAEPPDDGQIIETTEQYWVETLLLTHGADRPAWTGRATARARATTWRMAEYMRDEAVRSTGCAARIVIETTTVRLAGNYAYPTADRTGIVHTPPGTPPAQEEAR